MKQIIKFDNQTACSIEFKGEAFTFVWSGVNDKLVRCGGENCMMGVNPACGHLPAKDELKDFDFSCRTWSIPEGGVFCLRKENGLFLAVKVIAIDRSDVEWTVDFEYEHIM